MTVLPQRRLINEVGNTHIFSHVISDFEKRSRLDNFLGISIYHTDNANGGLQFYSRSAVILGGYSNYGLEKAEQRGR